jgi:hypothetical protein
MQSFRGWIIGHCHPGPVLHEMKPFAATGGTGRCCGGVELSETLCSDMSHRGALLWRCRVKAVKGISDHPGAVSVDGWQGRCPDGWQLQIGDGGRGDTWRRTTHVSWYSQFRYGRFLCFKGLFECCLTCINHKLAS